MKNMQMLAIQNLQKTYGKQTVLRNISYHAAQGDVVALLGSSGSGKSTLLRCINLLEQPDNGNLQIDDININYQKLKKSSKQAKKLRTKVGMVFQQFNLWSHMNVLQNLCTAPIHVLKKNKLTVNKQAKELLHKVGLLDKQNHYPAQLSGGEQQRVAIARALMMEPKIMLFDEPTSALDPEKVVEVLNVIKALAAEGMTMFIATHEIGFAREVSTHTIFLEQGIILEAGKSNKILFNPKTARLQQFLASVYH